MTTSEAPKKRGRPAKPAQNVVVHEPKAAPVAAAAPANEAGQFMAMIASAAANPAVDVEKMRALMEMRKDFLAAQAKQAFVNAMAEVQPRLPTIDRKGGITVWAKKERDAIAAGQVTEEQLRANGVRPQQSTPYATFEDIDEAISPILGEHGLTLTFRSEQGDGGKLRVIGVLRHRDGHEETSFLDLQYDSTGSKNAVQSAGSTLKYGMRYNTLLLLKIRSRAPTERDDDGKAGGAPSPITAEQVADLYDRMEAIGMPEGALVDYLNGRLKLSMASLSELPEQHFGLVADKIAQTARQRQKGN